MTDEVVILMVIIIIIIIILSKFCDYGWAKCMETLNLSIVLSTVLSIKRIVKSS